MPRKPNYGLNKNRKEQDRKAKKDAKAMDKQQRRAQQSLLKNVDPPQPTKQADGDTQLRVPPNEDL